MKLLKYPLKKTENIIKNRILCISSTVRNLLSKTLEFISFEVNITLKLQCS